MARARSRCRWLLPLFIAVLTLSLIPHSTALAESHGCDVLIIDPLCEAGKKAVGVAKDVVTAPMRFAAGSAVDMITSWVADAVQWILKRIVGLIDHSTSPKLDAGWFTERYRFMIGLASLIVAPMLLIATIRSVMNQDLSQLLRSFFVYLPVAILATFVAVHFAQSLLAITDALSAAVAQGVGGDISGLLDGIGETLSGGGALGPGVPSFAIFLGALLIIFGALFVWLELLVRSAAVTVSVFFLPVVLAGLVWPATARWTRRLIELLVAVIFSKFVIVAVISLATAAFANPGRGGFSAVMAGAALMLMAAFSPFVLLKLMPGIEAAAISSLEGLSRRPLSIVQPGGSVNHAVSTMRAKLASGSQQGLAVAGPKAAAGAAAGAGGPAGGGGAAAPAALAAGGGAAPRPGTGQGLGGEQRSGDQQRLGLGGVLDLVGAGDGAEMDQVHPGEHGPPAQLRLRGRVGGQPGVQETRLLGALAG
jgi:hypothetical protein